MPPPTGPPGPAGPTGPTGPTAPLDPTETDAARAADAAWEPVWRALRRPDEVPDDWELIVVGGELEPDVVLSAYRHGLFPMGVGRGGRPPVGWWSPNPRGVFLPGGLRVSRSLRKSVRRFEVSVDTDFEGVVRACADPGRTGRWITPAVVAAYTELHARGHAHSVEVRRDGELVGGLYGVGIGGLFAGESMFHRATDASKVALVALVERVLPTDGSARLLDVQWVTPHLASLGAVELPRTDYLDRLDQVLSAPAPSWSPFSGAPGV